jgi:hypothetical protein
MPTMAGCQFALPLSMIVRCEDGGRAEATRPVTISGQPGDDAKHYQVRAVELAIEEVTR